MAITLIQSELINSIMRSAVQVILVCPVNVGSWRKGRRTAEHSELPAHNARGTLMHLLSFQTVLNTSQSFKPVSAV